MEDPIRFDVYAKISGATTPSLISVLMASKGYGSELHVRKTLNRSRHDGEHVLVGKSLSWSEARRLIATPLPFEDPCVTQEGYSPSECDHYCAKHSLHHSGCLGCHVCSGFYVA